MPETLIILSPAFSEDEAGNWLPAQSAFIRALNHYRPDLEVIILAFRRPVAPGKTYTWHGNTVYAFGSGRHGKLHTLRLWQKVWSKLRHIRKTKQVMGIFSFFCVECALIGHYFAQRHGITHKIWVLGQDARATNRQVARIRPAADELVAISDFLVREFQHSHGIKPAHMIPIGIYQDLFPAPAPVRNIDVLGVGSLSVIKRYDLFIEIVQEAATRMGRSIRAGICGSGEDEERLKRLVSKHKTSGSVALLGEQSHQDAMRHMRRARILLHPSDYEGYGMVCAEALYAGAHVISFRKPMDREISHWHTVSDKEEMILKLIELLNDPCLDHTSVLTQSMETTVSAILRLFGDQSVRS